jgi:RNA polymerase sigma-70 factor, ECF subfamily
VQRSVRRADRGTLSLDEAEAVPDDRADVSVTDRRLDLQRVMGLVHSLRPFDRQLMLLYLQDLHRRRSNRSRSQQGRPRARQAHALQRE